MKVFAVILWLLTLICWGVMLMMTHGSPDEVRQLPIMVLNDKVDHILAFGLLGGLLSLSLWAMFPKRPAMLWLALPVLLAYALLDEKTRGIASSDIQMRHWLADAIGSGIAVAGVFVLGGLSRLLVRTPAANRARLAQDGRPAATVEASFPNDLGMEVESALASYGQADADVGEPIIRVEKTSGPLPASPIRVTPRRLK